VLMGQQKALGMAVLGSRACAGTASGRPSRRRGASARPADTVLGRADAPPGRGH
jgi:hypothetical protein